jgi:hypothetical protein
MDRLLQEYRQLECKATSVTARGPAEEVALALEPGVPACLPPDDPNAPPSTGGRPPAGARPRAL